MSFLAQKLWHVYACGPVDFWYGWGEADAFVLYLKALAFGGDDLAGDLALDFERGLSEARELAKECGWEGDGIWRFSALPNPYDCDTKYMYVVKQNNNGSVWIVSPLPLTWLDSEQRVR